MSLVLLCLLLVSSLALGQRDFQMSYFMEQMNQYCDLRCGGSSNRAAHQAAVPRVGKAGPRGPPGVPGIAAEVDYSRVDSVVDEKLRGLQDKLAEMERVHGRQITEMERLHERQITEMENKLEGFYSRQLLLNPHCKVYYQGKCFWAIETTEQSTAALRRCESSGGHGANIYDATHFEMIRKYLATIFSDDDDLFTGMKYNGNTGVLSFVNGTQSSFKDWYAGEPGTGTIMFDVAKRSNPSTAGFWTSSSSTRRDEGVLCEM